MKARPITISDSTARRLWLPRCASSAAAIAPDRVHLPMRRSAEPMCRTRPKIASVSPFATPAPCAQLRYALPLLAGSPWTGRPR
jgi:hypothetical protein